MSVAISREWLTPNPCQCTRLYVAELFLPGAMLGTVDSESY